MWIKCTFGRGGKKPSKEDKTLKGKEGETPSPLELGMERPSGKGMKDSRSKIGKEPCERGNKRAKVSKTL